MGDTGRHVPPDAPQSDPASEPLSGVVAGRFAISTRLGVGGMGEVYRARDLVLNRAVALKRPSASLRSNLDYRQRLIDEARRACQISDPHIAGIYDVTEDKGDIFLVMELVEGATLRGRLGTPLPLPDFFAIAIECAQALVAAHAHGVIHSDIKPENIMLTSSGHVKILDFGLAHQIPDAEQETQEHGSLFGGTPAYMAPEILLHRAFDQRADIFSLGVVFYEMLTGKNPFAAGWALATATRLLHENAAPADQVNPAVPPEVAAVVARMLQKDPEARYATAGQVVAELRLAAGEPASAIEASGFSPARRRSRRAHWLAAAGVLLALLGAVAFALPGIRAPLLRRLHPATVPAVKHVAVIPFENVGKEAASQPFCDGLTWVLSSKLAEIERFQGALFMVPAGEVVKENIHSASEARAQFGVNLVISGSVQRAGNRVRITADLIDAASMRTLRSFTYDGDAGDVSTLQDGMATRVAGLLDLAIEPDAHTILGARGTSVAAANDYYIQGRGYLQNYTRAENIENAITVLRHALELDPKYALAHAALGEAYWHKYSLTHEKNWVDAAEASCRQAVASAPALAGTHACLGTVYVGTGRYEGAVREYQNAIKADPASDEAHRGLAAAYESQRRYDDAERAYLRAIELRPSYWAGYNWLGSFYNRRGRYSDAIRMFQQVVALAPDSFLGYRNLGAIYYFSGDYADAILMFERSVAIRPTARAYSNLATAYFTQRRFSESAANFEQALKYDPNDYLVWGNLGDAYRWTGTRPAAATGAYERAIALAGRAIEINPRDETVLEGLARCHAGLGQAAQARAFLDRARAAEGETHEWFFNAAQVYALLGEDKRALDAVQKSLELHHSVAEVRDTPMLDRVRHTTRFRELIERNQSR